MRTHWGWRLVALGALALGACRAEQDATGPVETTARAAQRIVATPGGVDILTFHGDAARTGWNRHETVLTPANVRPETFGLIAEAMDIQGEVMGSPVFASNLPVHDASTNADVTADVLMVATMNNNVYALSADDLHTMWRFDFEGRRPPFATDLQSCQSPYPIGVMSTPVISPDRQLIYVVGRLVGDSASDSIIYGYALHTRDGTVAARFRVGEYLGPDGTTRVRVAADGTDRGAPVRQVYNPNQYTQRAALLLVNNLLYIGTGGICDTPGFRGWLLAYDVTRLSEQAPPAGVYLATPGGGGGIWSAGGAASDGTSIFVATGNGRAAIRAGTPEAQRSIADALVRLTPTLALDTHACFNASNLAAACGAGDATNLTNVFMPRNAELLARDNIEDADPFGDLSGPDEDFGSSSPVLVPPAELPENRGVDGGRAIAALGGKDGFFYLIDREHMGGVGPSPLRTDTDIPALVGAELYGEEIFLHSTSGGIRASAAYFETHSGRYLYVIGADEIGGRADAPRGLAALRLRSVTDPTPAECARQFRQIAYHGTSVPCGTIWGATPRPGFEMAWSGNGPLVGATPHVSSNGFENGIVWITHHRFDDTGLLVAYAADQGPGTNRVVTPLYRSDRVPDDRLHGTATSYAAPIVANGRVYVSGVGVAAFGLIPQRELPPVTEPPPPPDCAPGVSWESAGRPFMTQYCTNCHAEYNDLPFIQRRRARVLESIAPADGSRPRMPLVRDPSMPPPLPSADELARVAAWLTCGAPAARVQMHAGFEAIPAMGTTFIGDGDYLDPNRTGVLSSDRRAEGFILNPFAPAVPDRVFAFDRTGPTGYRVPVPGAGHYAVTLYLAEMACAAAGGPDCGAPFDVRIGGNPWLTNVNVVSRVGPRRAMVQSTAVDLPATSRLTLDVSAGGRVQGIEVVRTEACTMDGDCPTGFVCRAGACSVGDDRVDGGIGPDAGVYEGGLPPPPDSGRPGADGGMPPNGADVATGIDGGDVQNTTHCSCRAAGARGPNRVWALALAACTVALARRGARGRRRQ